MRKSLLNNIPLFLIFLLSILIIWPVFLPGYFSHQDDLQVMRIFEMRRCFADFQLPCRWTPDLGYGNGFPLFNYYSVFPYYLGALISYVFGFIGAAKVLFLIPLLLGGLSFYLLTNKLYGKTAGFAGAILFIFAPYRALDSYVRGAVAESFAIAIVPLVFYFSLSLINRKTFLNFLALVLSLTALLTSHNIMVLFFVPILFIWVLYWLINKKWQNLFLIILALVLGFGLSTFFIIPALFEQSLVQTDNLTRSNLDFRANFVSIEQIFWNRSWNYDNSLSFQVGWPQVWLAGLAPLFLLVMILSRTHLALGLLFLALFLGSLFMMHIKSSFIWEKMTILHFVQFPWRFLAIAIFSAGFLGSLLVSLFSQKWRIGLVVLITTITVLLNWNYFRPKEFYPSLTDREKLSGTLWDVQSRAAIMDYLPKTAIEAKEPAPASPIVDKGKARIDEYKNYSNRWQFKIVVEEPSIIEVPVYDFPNWVVKVNREVYPHNHNNYIGRIGINLAAGEYRVEGFLYDTKVRSFANITSLISLLTLVMFVVYGKHKKIFT